MVTFRAGSGGKLQSRRGGGGAVPLTADVGGYGAVLDGRGGAEFVPFPLLLLLPFPFPAARGKANPVAVPLAMEC